MHFGHFLLCFYPSYSPKKENFKKAKTKKILEISSFYTIVPKILVISYTISEVWHLINVIAIFRFGLCFALLPSNSSNNKNFKTMKIMHRDIIILHNSAKNHNPMCLTSLGYTVSGIWHVTHVIVLFFFQFGLFFAFPHLHTPLTDQKIKAFQKIKQLLEALSF